MGLFQDFPDLLQDNKSNPKTILANHEDEWQIFKMMHIFYCKVVQKYLKNVDQVEFLTTRKHISQDFVETTGPTKNYFMLIASLFSDNIGLFYDILSVDFSFACKQPSILNWTHPFWTGENVARFGVVRMGNTPNSACHTTYTNR